MQWLIDTIKDWVNAQGFLTAGFVNRGDPANYDFDKTDFTQDGTWRELNLQSIVPEGAKAILLKVALRNTFTAKYFNLRDLGNVNGINAFTVQTLVGNLTVHEDGVCPIGEDRKLEYNITAVGWTSIFFTVKGWWF